MQACRGTSTLTHLEHQLQPSHTEIIPAQTLKHFHFSPRVLLFLTCYLSQYKQSSKRAGIYIRTCSCVSKVLQSSLDTALKCLPHLTSLCADTAKSTPMHSLHMEKDHKRPTKTFQHTDTCYIKCACGYFWSELFLLVCPIPALQCHSIKASSCVYLYYSPTHAFTLIIFSSFFQNVAVPCSYLVEAAN